MAPGQVHAVLRGHLARGDGPPADSRVRHSPSLRWCSASGEEVKGSSSDSKESALIILKIFKIGPRAHHVSRNAGLLRPEPRAQQATQHQGHQPGGQPSRGLVGQPPRHE
eukprot:991717-Prorocentrum_minimum.AAC.1